MHAPAVVVVAVNVQDLLSLDTEHTREDAFGQSCAQHNDIVLRGNLIGHVGRGGLCLLGERKAKLRRESKIGRGLGKLLRQRSQRK